MPRKQEYPTEIDNYIIKQSNRPHKWLQEHINKKFGVLLPLETIRSKKRRWNCLTDLDGLKRQAIEYIRHNYLQCSDKELAIRLENKLNRKFSTSFVKNIRLKHYWFKPVVIKGLTVKEIRICPNCGTEIKITCRNPNQKFCCTDCASKYHRINTYKRHLKNTTPEEVKAFMKEWTGFTKRVMYENRYSLTRQDLDDIKAEYYGIIPSIISGLKNKGYTRRQHVKGYIAKAIRNLIFKKLRKVIDMERNEIKFNNIDEDDNREDFFSYLVYNRNKEAS